jgi:Ca2+:H+ antiporter
MISLAAIFDYGGEQLAMYCGQSLGDLIIITMNNFIEAALPVVVILLHNCE